MIRGVYVAYLPLEGNGNPSAMGSCFYSLCYRVFLIYLTAQLSQKIRDVLECHIFLSLCLFLFLLPLFSSMLCIQPEVGHPAGNITSLTQHQLLQAGYSWVSLSLSFLCFFFFPVVSMKVCLCKNTVFRQQRTNTTEKSS